MPDFGYCRTCEVAHPLGYCERVEEELDARAAEELESPASSQTCDFEWSGYPHEGCAEFSEPDEYSCDEKAEWKLTFANEVPVFDDEREEHVYFCNFHGHVVLNDCYGDLLGVAPYVAPFDPDDADQREDPWPL